jgi:hypothetical protein
LKQLLREEAFDLLASYHSDCKRAQLGSLLLSDALTFDAVELDVDDG